MKRLVPLLALLPLIVSYPISGQFVLPTTLLILGFTALLAIFAPKEEVAPSIGLFWLAPLGTMWAISERREGREVWEYAVQASLGLATIGTIWLLRRGVPRHLIPLVVAAILTWCVSYFGGKSGGAENMKPYYGFLGLSPESTWLLIVWTRKLIHVTFYSLLATVFFRFLKSIHPRPYLPALGFALTMAACDEWRQNMMPNREGSIRDVLLDIGAASLWLWWLYLRKSSATQATPDPALHE